MHVTDAFENLLNGIRDRWEALALHRMGLRLPQEDLQEDPLDYRESDQIDFVTLSPNSDSPEQLRSFSQLGEGWIRRHSDSFVFDQAQLLVRDYRVLLRQHSKNHLQATIEDTVSYPVEIVLTGGDSENCLTSICTCRRSQQSLSEASRRTGWLRCEHSIAALLYLLQERITSDAAGSAHYCPITRQQLTADRPIYLCAKCQICYSQEGWDFLSAQDRGRCCHCHHRKTIRLLRPGA